MSVTTQTTTTTQVTIKGAPDWLRERVSRQVDAFFEPAAAQLLDELRNAGVGIPSAPRVEFHLIHPPPPPGHPGWSAALPPAEQFGLGRASCDYGLALLERILVQLIELHGPRTLSNGEAHALACEAIERHVDAVHVPALDIAETADAASEVLPTPPSALASRSTRARSDALVVALAANGHDSSVVFATEERVLLVLEAERVYRRKHKRCRAREFDELLACGLAWIGRDVDSVTHWTGTAMLNPLLPEAEQHCEWARATTAHVCSRRVPFHAVNHHLAHAASAFALPIRDAVVEASDGGGDSREYATFRLRGDDLEPIAADREGFSAVFYDVLSYYTYKRYGAEGKFMGLAGHGTPRADLVEWLEEHADALNRQPHEDSYALLHRRFGIDRHDPDDPLVRDLAHAAQRVFERRRVAQVRVLAGQTPNVVLTGGAALNIHANSAIADGLPEHAIHVPPCCDDSGQALGAALHTLVTELGVRPRVELPFLGRGTVDPPAIDEATADRVVDDLIEHRVVAWHYGRAEIGPRALGHRSLLCVPFTTDDRVLVSERVKRRESYRPVAPVVLDDSIGEWFAPARRSPYMLFAVDATERCREEAPAVVHVDGSARVQTVARHEQPLGPILAALQRRTGVPVLVNTSLNGPGEPIVDSPSHTLAFARERPLVVPWIDGTRCCV
jgi:carbamoyltransferase